MVFFSSGKGGGEEVEYGYKGKGVTSHLLVDSEGRPLAITTTSAKGDERDQVDPLLKKVPLVRDFAQEILEKHVREFMTSQIISVMPATSLVAAAQTMVAERVHRLLVIDPEGRMKGILGSLDILQALIPALSP